MAKIVLKDAYVEVDGVDLSDHSNHITIESSADEVDLTSFGATAKETGLGIPDATINATFFQDFASGSVDATLWPIHQAGSAVPVVVKPTSGAVSATNPSYTMTAIIPSYNPLDGDVGAASTTQVAFRNASQTGLVRATS